MTAVVFAGPSLAGASLPPSRGITLRPPAEAGDLYLAARSGATVIGLIDGAFEDRPTVWHKEILWALDRGVRVLGASSLGALRAAECAAFGMEGVGRIYERARSGALENDHELALAHAPAELGYAALSEPLVNVRATLEAAGTAAIVPPASAKALVSRAGAMPYKSVTWPALLAESAAAGWTAAERDRFAAWLPAGRVDLKRADALELLAAVGEGLAHPVAPARVGFRFNETRHWQRAVARFEARAAEAAPETAVVLDELRLDPARFERAMVRAYARRAATAAAVADEVIEEADLLDDLRLDLGLGSATDFRSWMSGAGTNPAALAAALRDEERLMLAIETEMSALGPAVLDALRVEGRFDALRDRARDKALALAGAPEPTFDEAELHGLIAALCSRRRVTIASDDPDVVARSLGLSDRRSLHRLLRREQTYLDRTGAS
jgi:hypothetical protein